MAYRKKSSTNKKIAVLYHDRCSDGFSSAWAAWKKFGDKAEYIGVLHQTLPPKGLRGKEIYMLDFSYKPEIMRDLRKIAHKIVVIEHHVSALENIKEADESVFDNNKSGAVLSWEYFNKNKKIPKLSLYVQDRDLWKWELPKSREINAFLDTVEFSFENWDSVSRKLENPRSGKKISEIGSVILNYKDRLVERVSKNYSKAVFEDKIAYVVNSGLFESEIGEYLVKLGAEIGVIWQKTKDGIRVSLRSPEHIDVSEIAKKYGGGGHKQAAGFLLTRTSAVWGDVSTSVADGESVSVKKYIKVLEKRAKRYELEISKLKKLVDRDFLTGLFNRRGFLEEISRFIDAIKKEQSIFNRYRKERKLQIGNITVLFFDLKKFKEINDKFGHKHGDDALKKIAQIISEKIRDTDIAARWSGDEFVAALIGDDIDNAKITIDRIKKAVRDARKKDKKIPDVDIGASAVFEKGRKPEWIYDVGRLIDLADRRMYVEKRKTKHT